MKRKWLPTFAELIDRLSIDQLKEVFITEHRDKYDQEMKLIMNDLDTLIKEKDNIVISSKLIRAIIVLAQINTHIWYNESKARKGEAQDLALLKLTHSLNGIRNTACNYILELIKEKSGQNWKIDCLAEEFKNDWQISLFDEK